MCGNRVEFDGMEFEVTEGAQGGLVRCGGCHARAIHGGGFWAGRVRMGCRWESDICLGRAVVRAALAGGVAGGVRATRGVSCDDGRGECLDRVRGREGICWVPVIGRCLTRVYDA